MDGIFKIYGKEDVLGRLRNIYSKMKKDKTLGKTKYIKSKGEFIRLSTYIKENAKDAKKATKAAKAAKATQSAKAAKAAKAKRSILKKHRKIIVIDNINNIKDTKIRHLFLKTFKKNSKIYIYSDNKKWKGGGIENYDEMVTQDNGTDRGIFDLSELTPPKIYMLRYNENIDGIIAKIIDIGTNNIAVPNLFEQISNLKYKISYSVNGYTSIYSIRPYISIKDDLLIINFYINIDNIWIKLPIHITLYLRDMTKYANEYQIIIITGFLHITCDNNIRIFNKLQGSTKTHLYLKGKDFNELSQIMKTHGEKMFLHSGYVTGNADIEVNTYTPILSTTSGANIIWGTMKDTFKLDDDQLKTDINDIIQNHLPKIFRHIFMMFNLERTSVPMGGIVTESVPENNTKDYIHISVDPLIDTSTGNIKYTDTSNTIKRSYELKTKDIKSQRGRSGNLGTPRSGSRSHTAMVVDTPISVSRPVTPRSENRPVTPISVSRPHSAMVVDTPSGHRLPVPMFYTLHGDTSDGRSSRSGDTSYGRSYDRREYTSDGRSDGRSSRSGDTSYGRSSRREDRSYGRSSRSGDTSYDRREYTSDGRSDGRSGDTSYGRSSRSGDTSGYRGYGDRSRSPVRR